MKTVSQQLNNCMDQHVEAYKLNSDKRTTLIVA